MLNASAIPSHFASPFVTTIPGSRYDSRGRQLDFKESEVQRLERLAFANASKSPGGSPTQSPTSSSSGSPAISTRKMFISEPFNDPIELFANQLASELFDTDDFLSLYDDVMEAPDSITPQPHRGHSSASSPSYISTPSSQKISSSSFRTRKKTSLSLIPEED